MEKDRSGRRRVALSVCVVALLGITALGFAFLREPAADERPAASVSIKTMSVPVEGMSCGSCVASVKRTVKALDGVHGVDVSLEERRAKVQFEDGRTTPERIAAAIKELGYKTGDPVLKEAGK